MSAQPTRVDIDLVWGLGGAAALALGSIAPWFVSGPLSIAGTSYNHRGFITLGIAVIVAIAVVARVHYAVVGVLGLAALGIGGYYFFDVRSIAQDGGALLSASVGWGLILVAAAGAALVAWAASAWARSAPDRA